MTSTFSTDYIDPEISKSLSPEYKLRPLQLSDYESGYLDVLSDLTAVGNISKEMFAAQVEFMRARSGEYFGIVIEKTSTGKVVAVGTLLVEHKFIHECGLVGHIEDIAVAKSEQGKKLGIKIIHALDFIGKKAGCYKNILDCSAHNEQFYVKCKVASLFFTSA
ncbi:acyl-CoA N-acyltransferase [Kockiozyma suomiensis]|uniref:acyl-CoA N-acyltransferase n=1 Tax=Kockiozyma suomiensis TaxID=1337062 RepID=UPI003343FEA5